MVGRLVHCLVHLLVVMWVEGSGVILVAWMVVSMAALSADTKVDW